MPKEVKIDLSTFKLNELAQIKRVSDRCMKLRYTDFEDRFDANTYFYDIFWGAGQNELIAICPRLGNLQHDANVRFVELPSGEQCSFEIVSYLQVDEIRVKVSPKTTSLKITINNQTEEIVISPRATDSFSGTRALVTLSKNNPLIWIRDWANFYVNEHGVNSIIIYDNGSDLYDLDEISAVLADIDGLDIFSVINWNFKYGPADYRRAATVGMAEYQFCQPGALLHSLKRICGKAEGIINADIDELIYSHNNTPLFKSLAASKSGYFRIYGHWVEAKPSCEFVIPRHKHFSGVAKEKIKTHMEAKWVIAPNKLPEYIVPDVHYVHLNTESVEGIHFQFAHFRAISTNWDYHSKLTSDSKVVVRTDFNQHEEVVENKALRDILDRHFADDDDIVRPIIEKSYFSLERFNTKHIPTELVNFNEDDENTASCGQLYTQKLFLLSRLFKSSKIAELQKLPPLFTSNFWHGATMADKFNNEVYFTAQKILKSTSSRWDFLVCVVQLFQSMEMMDDAAELIFDLNSKETNCSDGRFFALCAHISLKNKKFSTALNYINQALSIDDGCPGYYYIKGEILRSKKDFSGSEASYLRAIELLKCDHWQKGVILEVSKVYSKVGRPCSLSRQIRFCTVTGPYIGYARLLIRMKRFSEAFKIIKTGLSHKYNAHDLYLLGFKCLKETNNVYEYKSFVILYKEFRAFMERTGFMTNNAQLAFNKFRIRDAQASLFMGEIDRACELYHDLLRDKCNPQKLNPIIFCAAEIGLIDEAKWLLASRSDIGYNDPLLANEKDRIQKIQKSLERLQKLQHPQVWIYWDSGFSTAPPIIKASVQTAILKSCCEVKLMDKQMVAPLLSEVERVAFNCLRPAHQADIFRIAILEMFGGMYIDADTIVVEDLRPLFALLSQFSIVGADWCPARHPLTKVAYGVGIIGPVRPNHKLLRRVREKQQSLLKSKITSLTKYPWTPMSSNKNYPFHWQELLGDIFHSLTKDGISDSYILDGADSWYAYVGGPSWEGGNGRHLYRPLLPGEFIKESQLYTYSYSLAPKVISEMPLNELLDKNWLLSELLKKGLCV